MGDLTVQGYTLPSIPELRDKLSQCQDIEEVMQMRASFKAIETLVRDAKVRGEIYYAVAESKLRIERRVGEMLAEMEKNKGGRPSENPSHDDRSFSIADIGINYSQSSRWQKIAGIPEESFQVWVDEQIEKEKELTLASLNRFANTLSPKTKPEPRPFEIMQAVREVRDRIESLAESWPDDCKRTLGEFLVSVGEEYIEQYGGEDV